MSIRLLNSYKIYKYYQYICHGLGLPEIKRDYHLSILVSIWIY